MYYVVEVLMNYIFFLIKFVDFFDVKIWFIKKEVGVIVVIVCYNNLKYYMCMCMWVCVYVVVLYIGLWFKVNWIGVMKGYCILFLLFDD